MSNVSCYIIAFNEERKIRQAVSSVIDWADEVIVCDSFSTDRTAEIASELGAKVVQIPFEGFGKLRNEALTQCSHPWIFSLDSDERCTPESRDEILSIVRTDDPDGPVAYWMPRKNFLLGRWVKHSGWYPDYRQPQLFRQGQLSYTLEEVHEGFICEGPIGHLTAPIWQFPFENLSQMLKKADRYSSLGAEKLRHKTQGGLGKGLLHGASIFIQSYLFKSGWRDGRAGLAIAVGAFIGTFYKYAKLAELQQQWEEPTQPQVGPPDS
ncbi:MAG: glycosyltransferase family 2 protein [Litorivicinaceae bacterium]